MRTRTLLTVLPLLLASCALGVSTPGKDVQIGADGITVEKDGKTVNLGGSTGITATGSDGSTVDLGGSTGITATGSDGATVEVGGASGISGTGSAGGTVEVTPSGIEVTGEGIVANPACEDAYQAAVAANAESYDDCYPPATVSCTPNVDTNVMVVLDSSGSMGLKLGTQRKIDIAKAEAKTYIGTLADASSVGLMVYGHQGNNTGAGKAVSCAGIETVVPVGAYDAAALTAAVDRLKPTGWTPIASALAKAQSALRGKPGLNVVVLVSDGEETCGGNPTSAAAALRGAGAVVHVIGFGVNADEEQQLGAIARSGGGSYATARDAAELRAALLRTAVASCLREEALEYAARMRQNGACLTRYAAQERAMAAVIRSLGAPCGPYVLDRWDERADSIREQLQAMRDAIKATNPTENDDEGDVDDDPDLDLDLDLEDLDLDLDD